MKKCQFQFGRSAKKYSDLDISFIVESIKDHRSDFEDVRELQIPMPLAILSLTT